MIFLLKIYTCIYPFSHDPPSNTILNQLRLNYVSFANTNMHVPISHDLPSKYYSKELRLKYVIFKTHN